MCGMNVMKVCNHEMSCFQNEYNGKSLLKCKCWGNGLFSENSYIIY